MLDTKPVELTLAIEKLSKGFAANTTKPTDDDIINTLQLLVPVLMSTTYDELKNEHNISGVILLQIRYEKIYGVGPFTIPPLVSLYETSIATNDTRAEVH